MWAFPDCVVDWMDHWSATGRSLSKRSLKYKLEKVIRFRPAKRWITKFLARHPTICLGKPSGLDPCSVNSLGWLKMYYVLMCNPKAQNPKAWVDVHNEHCLYQLDECDFLHSGRESVLYWGRIWQQGGKSTHISPFVHFSEPFGFTGVSFNSSSINLLSCTFLSHRTISSRESYDRLYFPRARSEV